MPEAKLKIKICVNSYKRSFPQDYHAVVTAVHAKRQMNRDEFASIQGSDTAMRGLYEIPETLHNMLVANLSVEELLWLKMGTKQSPNEGGRWFAKTFREFSLPDKI